MMKKQKIINLFYFSFIILIFSSCGDDEDVVDNNSNNFDRNQMLTNWADNIIIPSYENFVLQTEILKNVSDNFHNSPTMQNLTNLRIEFEKSYLSWQSVEMFNIGPAKDLILRPNLNIYPTNAQNIDNFIINGDYNLEDINLNDEQGFPALDYLLYGIAETDADILQLYDNDFNGEKYTKYVRDVVDRINLLANQTLEAWQEGYRDVFVSNSGSSANSSVDVFVNEYLLYYERFFRNGKIGFPAGVFSGGNPDATKVEAYYSRDLSKKLCLQALSSFQNFFNGKHVNNNENGESLQSYLDFLNTQKEGENLSTLINNQFEVSKNTINTLEDNFYNEVLNNNNAMLNAFEELQANVIYLKSDLFSALSISLTFESGDGD